MGLVAGVETVEQQRFLAAAGVHFMQGYPFGQPAPKPAITDRPDQEARRRIKDLGRSVLITRLVNCDVRQRSGYQKL